jgi:hypothetical protein
LVLEELIGKEKINRLIISLKSPKKWRVMDPIEIAETLNILCQHFPKEEVARRLGISKEGTLWVYLRLVNLSEKVKNLIKTGKIGEDVGYRISLLPNQREQEILAEAVVRYRLTSNDVKGIVQNLKKRNPHLSIGECIEIALKAKPIIQEKHVVITRIKNDTLELLKNKAKRESCSLEDVAKKCLQEVFPSEALKSLKMMGTTVVLVLEKKDFNLFKHTAAEMKVKPEILMDVIIKRGLSG